MELTGIVTALGVLVALTNLIVEVAKRALWDKLPTDLLALIVGVVLTVTAGLAWCQIRGAALTWYMAGALLVAGFMVAYAAMFGFDKLKEILDRLGSGRRDKGNRGRKKPPRGSCMARRMSFSYLNGAFGEGLRPNSRSERCGRGEETVREDRQELRGTGLPGEGALGQGLQQGAVVCPDDTAHCPDVPLHGPPVRLVSLGHVGVDPFRDQGEPFRLLHAQLHRIGHIKETDVIRSHAQAAHKIEDLCLPLHISLHHAYHLLILSKASGQCRLTPITILSIVVALGFPAPFLYKYKFERVTSKSNAISVHVF